MELDRAGTAATGDRMEAYSFFGDIFRRRLIAYTGLGAHGSHWAIGRNSFKIEYIHPSLYDPRIAQPLQDELESAGVLEGQDFATIFQ